MTPEEQRIAIATVCGWNPIPENDNSNLGWGVNGRKPYWHFVHQLPNYLEDLNACQEMEKTLSGEIETAYYITLLSVVGHFDNINKAMAHATAAQRAEAFLKWKDSAMIKTDRRPPLGGWATGNYWNKCTECGVTFVGDKRAVVCADCAYSGHDLLQQP